jgi:hypothetical protein
MSRKKFLAIVDPWASPQPHDAEEFPHLESDSEIQYQLIHNQLPRLKSLFDDIIVDDSGYTCHPMFEELPRVNVLEGYLSDKQDWDMWLCGFHYGRCIHNKVKKVVKQYDWDYSRFHIIQNLSFAFPRDTKDIIIGGYRTKDAVLNTKEYYWDYVGSLSEL